jgi:hypothetical protein
VSQDDEQTTQEQAAADADRERSEARGAELRAELAETDARRTEEQADKAHEAAEAARKEEEKRRAQQREEEERAERARAEAERERAEADHAAEVRDEATRAAGGVAGARPALPPPHEPQSAMERPEVLVGGAFVGAFVVARILKRLFD